MFTYKLWDLVKVLKADLAKTLSKEALKNYKSFK